MIQAIIKFVTSIFHKSKIEPQPVIKPWTMIDEYLSKKDQVDKYFEKKSK